jgi:hypothetical protein
LAVQKVGEVQRTLKEAERSVSSPLGALPGALAQAIIRNKGQGGKRKRGRPLPKKTNNKKKKAK